MNTSCHCWWIFDEWQTIDAQSSISLYASSFISYFSLIFAVIHLPCHVFVIFFLIWYIHPPHPSIHPLTLCLLLHVLLAQRTKWPISGAPPDRWCAGRSDSRSPPCSDSGWIILYQNTTTTATAINTLHQLGCFVAAIFDTEFVGHVIQSHLVQSHLVHFFSLFFFFFLCTMAY